MARRRRRPSLTQAEREAVAQFLTLSRQAEREGGDPVTPVESQLTDEQRKDLDSVFKKLGIDQEGAS